MIVVVRALNRGLANHLMAAVISSINLGMGPLWVAIVAQLVVSTAALQVLFFGPTGSMDPLCSPECLLLSGMVAFMF